MSLFGRELKRVGYQVVKQAPKMISMSLDHRVRVKFHVQGDLFSLGQRLGGTDHLVGKGCPIDRFGFQASLVVKPGKRQQCVGQAPQCDRIVQCQLERFGIRGGSARTIQRQFDPAPQQR